MLKHTMILTIAAMLATGVLAAEKKEKADDGWISIFDGKSLSGWTASENKDSCKVEDGKIVVKGPRSHLFYTGKVKDANFKNFEFSADVLTHPKANSGIYFHTKFQKAGWPGKGYEAQVNNTHGDPKKTGGLYNVKDVFKATAQDNKWFNYHIIVNGKRIIVKIDGQTTVDYTEPADLKRPGRQLSSGTFAFQAHDPGSRVEYKNIKVKLLP
jgi:hypothetical protein